MIVLAGGNAYTLAHEHKNAWNADAFRERFSEVLERYDYIVGDWGYSQLRLRGFYEEGTSRATKETTIAGLVDYLNEYCNFGCAYFVLTKTDANALPPGVEVVDIAAAAEVADTTAEGEPDVQVAETAAASVVINGILMRWPLKERTGGPVRLPNASAVARAAQEAERRNQQAQAGGTKPADGRSTYGNRDGGGGRSGGRTPGGFGADKRTGAGGAAEGRSSGKPAPNQQRGGRPQGGERQSGGASKPGGQWRQPDAGRAPDTQSDAEAGGPREGGPKTGGSRWPGKNRRRNRFGGGGKPNRPDGGGAPSREGGTPGKPGAD